MVPRPKTARLLPLLLVGALLLCHGAFGSLHQFHVAPETGLMVVEHAQSQQGHEAPDSDPQGTPDYVAAFFALLFWLVYGFLRSETHIRLAREVANATQRATLAKVSKLPRGPTPPLLQVFRS